MKSKKQTFPVLDMHCAGCANNVERTVRELDGMSDVRILVAFCKYAGVNGVEFLR